MKCNQLSIYLKQIYALNNKHFPKNDAKIIVLSTSLSSLLKILLNSTNIFQEIHRNAKSQKNIYDK